MIQTSELSSPSETGNSAFIECKYPSDCENYSAHSALNRADLAATCTDTVIYAADTDTKSKQILRVTAQNKVPAYRSNTESVRLIDKTSSAITPRHGWGWV